MLCTTLLSYWQYLKGFEILLLKIQCKLIFLHFTSTLTHWYYHESNEILKFTLPTIQATHEVLENGLKPCGDIFISTSLIFSITSLQYLVVRAARLDPRLRRGVCRGDQSLYPKTFFGSHQRDVKLHCTQI